MPTPPPELRPPEAARSSRAWLAVIPVISTLAIAGGIAAFHAASATEPGVPPTAPPPPRGPATEPAAAPATPMGIAWNRLASIDIHATTDQAKVAFRSQFPEADVQQDKDYRLTLAHPILNQAYYSWDWGCACLEHVVFFFKDYTTRMNTLPTFIPCLARELGPAATSAPPFDYDWPAHNQFPHVHVGPQLVMLSIEHETSEASYRNALRVLDSCRQ